MAEIESVFIKVSFLIANLNFLPRTGARPTVVLRMPDSCYGLINAHIFRVAVTFDSSCTQISLADSLTYTYTYTHRGHRWSRLLPLAAFLLAPKVKCPNSWGNGALLGSVAMVSARNNNWATPTRQSHFYITVARAERVFGIKQKWPQPRPRNWGIPHSGYLNSEECAED